MRGVMRRPICIIGLTFVIVILLYLYRNPYSEPSDEMYDGSTVTVTGQVDKKEYRISNGQENLVIYLKDVQFTNFQEQKNLICYMQGNKGVVKEPKIGSCVCIQGKFREFSQATNPGEFDARQYYQILNFHGSIQKGKLLEESMEYDSFREGLYQIRQYCGGLLELNFPAKEASIMRAMLLGEKSLLDEEVETLYQLNGVIHILSISGLHISIIGMGLYRVLCKLRMPRIITISISLIFIYCYGIMTGMSISAIRAIIMFGLRIVSGLCKRTYDMLTAMAIAAISILIEQPLYLYHSGFLFSFGAILGIGLLAPVVEENWIGNSRIMKIMSTNLAVSIFTFPVYLNFYYEYPLYSIFLNLLIIPGTSLLVTDGLLSIAGASAQLFLGKCLAIPSNILLWLYEMCCVLFLQLPGNRMITGCPAMWQIALFVAIICLAVLGNKKWTKLQFWQWILLAFLCITMRFQKGLQITMLDVGQGDCIYIADGRNGHYLIDGGSTSKSDVGTYQILPFLKTKGVSTLDTVFVTHMDEDHYNGIEELIYQTDQSGIRIEKLILPDICEINKTAEYEEFVELALQYKIPVAYIRSGDILNCGEVKFTCLHPNGCKDGCVHEGFTTNEESIVLYLEYKEFTALFTGDLEGDGEGQVCQKLKEIEESEDDESEDGISEGGVSKDEESKDEESKDDESENEISKHGITLLKVAHHGSKYSTDLSFLETTNPTISVISCGEDNSYGHPHTETLERLADVRSIVLTTPEYGAITIEVGTEIEVRSWVSPTK